VVRELSEISVINESCVVFNGAFILLLIVLAIVAIVAAVIGAMRRRAPT